MSQESNNTQSENSNKNKETKKPKPKGPLRTEAIIPFLLVAILTFAYFTLFFDRHLKSALELAGYSILGAQVDIGQLQTSLSKASLRVQNIQITNSQKPTHNMVEIGDIRFSVLWDALLRAKIVINEMAVEQIAIDTPRKSPGRVKPPEPVSPEAQGPSAAEKLKDKALGVVAEKNEDNVLSNLVSMLSGSSLEQEAGKIEGQLPSKEMLQKFEKELKAKTIQWEAKFKALPKPKEIQELGTRLGKVKVKDFKSPQELQQSVNEIDKILKEADAKYKEVQSTSGELQNEYKALEQDYQKLDAQIKQDIKDLEARFKIPSLDAKSVSKSLFSNYISPYKAQLNHYLSLYNKYAPPKFTNKNSKSDSETIKPHQRESGVIYEFPRANSYPLFWLKTISISSLANESKGTGALSGKILNITSNQKITGLPTTALLKGDFPSQSIFGFDSNLELDLRESDSFVLIKADVGTYSLDEKKLVDSSDLTLGFNKAKGSTQSSFKITNFKSIDGKINNSFSNVDYLITSKSPPAQEALQTIFKDLPPVSLNSSISGDFPSFNFSLDSNIGSEIEKSFRNLLNAKIQEAQKNLKAYVESEIGSLKAQVDKTMTDQKKVIEVELKKISDQINSEKLKAEAKVNQAKKDAENQTKKGVEAELKKALGSDGEKKLEDLKKKFGL
jgi:uncharacterized protein (TIGR03545 family)